MGWVVITYRLPSDHSRARVAVWRELRRSGALRLQQSVVAVPDTETFRPVVDRLRQVVTDVGGETLAVRADALDEPDQHRLVDAWNAARDAEYRELAAECEKFLAEIDHEFAIEKFTLAELEEEEAELDKLHRWHRRIADRDIHRAPAGPDATASLKRAEAALARYLDAVFHHTEPPNPAEG